MGTTATTRIVRTIGIVSLILNLVLLPLYISLVNADAEQRAAAKSKALARRPPSLEEVRQQRKQREVLKQRIAESESRLAEFGGEEWIGMSWEAAKTLMGEDLFVATRDGKIPLAVQEALSITTEENRRLEAENHALISQVREAEHQRVALASLDTDLTQFTIPADPALSASLREMMTLYANDILGPERGAILCEIQLDGHEFLQASDTSVAIQIRKGEDGSAVFSEKRQQPDGTPEGLQNERPLWPFNLQQLTERYGHIADVSAWQEFVYAPPPPIPPEEQTDHRSLFDHSFDDGTSLFSRE